MSSSIDMHFGHFTLFNQNISKVIRGLQWSPLSVTTGILQIKHLQSHLSSSIDKHFGPYHVIQAEHHESHMRDFMSMLLGHI